MDGSEPLKTGRQNKCKINNDNSFNSNSIIPTMCPLSGFLHACLKNMNEHLPKSVYPT